MVSEQEFAKLRQKASRARQARDMAIGQLDATKEQLLTEFGCKDISAAEKLLAQLARETKVAEKAYHAAVAAFEEKWDGNTAEA